MKSHQVTVRGIHSPNPTPPAAECTNELSACSYELDLTMWYEDGKAHAAFDHVLAFASDHTDAFTIVRDLSAWVELHGNAALGEQLDNEPDLAAFDGCEFVIIHAPPQRGNRNDN